MNTEAFVDKLEALTGDDKLQAMSEQLDLARDECTAGLVRLARVAHGDAAALDAMEGLALAIDRVEAVRQVVERPRFTTSGQEATR